ncbi:MAG: hypothetical protein AAGC85_11570 [Bacteroidota bacterium]
MKSFLISLILSVSFLALVTSCGTPFDAHEWRNWSEGEEDMEKGRRWKMVNSLLKNYELKGTSVADIKLLLGSKSLAGNSTWSDCEEGNCTISYYLGQCGSGMGWEDGELTITFKDGKVIEVEKTCV